MNSDRRAIALVTPQCTTTSQIVADAFGKRHDDVLRAIRALIEQAPELADQCARKIAETSRYTRTFAETFAQVPGPNGGTRQSPVYTMSRDGFTLLAMGFTGKKALTWKMAFIEAFNAMEEKLREGAVSPPPPAAVDRQAEVRRFNQIAHWKRTLSYAHQRLVELGDEEAAQGLFQVVAASPDEQLTDAQADALRDRINAFVRKVHGYGASKSAYGRAYAGISAAFGVTRYYRIPQSKFREAMDAVVHAVEWHGTAVLDASARNSGVLPKP